MLEKTGEIKPGQTPDTEQKLPEKTAAVKGDKSVIEEQTKQLDNDVTHRLSNAAAK
jgi:hypothetical protein